MRRYLSILSIFGVLSSLLFITTASASEGTTEVSTCTELQEVADVANGHNIDIVLLNDIDCTGFSFVPLDWDSSFSASFDGQNFTILNLDVQSDNFAGLFARMENATIQDLNIQGAVIETANFGGILSAVAIQSAITNVHVQGSVVLSSINAGGLVGSAERGTVISRSSSSGTVQAAAYVGGLVGNMVAAGNTSTAITNSWSNANATVVGGFQAGGLVGAVIGNASNGNSGTVTISDSYATGTVTNDGSVAGGLVGLASAEHQSELSGNVVISRTYATGSVTGSSAVGGLVGYAGDISDPNRNITIEDSFSVGLVTSGGIKGGLIGQAQGADHNVINDNNYWDEDQSGILTCVGDGTTDGGCFGVNESGEDNDYFKGNDDNQPISTWDVANSDWELVANDFPTLNFDNDLDGIETNVENAAPNDGDGNDDDIQDSEQEYVASFVSLITSEYVTLETTADCAILSVELIAESEFETQDGSYEFPVGMFSFELSCDIDTATIRLYYHSFEPSETNYIRKYNSTNGEFSTLTEREVLVGSFFVGGPNATLITYEIEDGGELDDDGEVNGRIVDPVGIAYQIPDPPAEPQEETQGLDPTAESAGESQGALSDTGMSSLYLLWISISLIIVGGILRRRSHLGI